MEKSEKPKKAKKSGIGHTHAIALDRSKRPNTAPPAEEIEAVLSEIIQPATFSLVRLYQEMGLRSRTLTLPVMVAFVTSLIWRQLGSVSEAARVLKREGMLWQPPIKISQQALSDRLRDLPASLFEAILNEILPQMQKRWQERNRPLEPTNRLSLAHFEQVLAVDGSTLDSLLKKCGLLRDSEAVELGGKMVALLDINNQLPQKVWYSEESSQHDQTWWAEILGTLGKDSLVLFDLGYVNYDYYRRLREEPKYFVTRVKSNMVYEVLAELDSTEAGIREQLVYIGTLEAGNRQLLRLVTVPFEGESYQYVTNVLDQARLNGREIAELYRQRWLLLRRSNGFWG
jgi:Transposase DDE domain